MRQRQEWQDDTYRELIDIAEEVVNAARGVLRQTRKTRGQDLNTDMAVAELRNEIEHFCGLGSWVLGPPA